MQHTNKISKAILVVLLGLAIGISDQAFAQTPNRGMASQDTAQLSCAGWNLATEFRLFPHQANPNPDNCGNANVWYFMESSTLVRDPMTYSLLPEFITDGVFISGLQQWQNAFNCITSCNDKLPTVGVNATGTIQYALGSIPWPAGVVHLHPMPEQLAIVGWRSPINGSISISGAFADMHGVCGDGVLWFVDQGATTLANGSIPDGGAPQGFQLLDVSVSEGDFLYFIVDPNGGFICDSTALEITLTPVEITTYRLTRIGDEVFNLSGVRPTIHDINENGEMAGSSPLVAGGPVRAILLSNDMVTNLGDLMGGAALSAIPSAINDFTQITGTNEIQGASGNLVTRGFLWQDGQVSDLGVDQIPLASPLDISNRGQIVGSSMSPENVERPFLWQAGTTTFLETELASCPGNLGGSARAINNNGVIVGSINSRAVLWQAGVGGITPLEPPSVLQRGEAVHVNDGGQVIGFYNNGAPETSTALLWQADQVTALLPLDDAQVTGAIPASINNLGQIVGHTNLGTRKLATLWRGSAVLDLNTLISDDDPAKGFVTLDVATEITDSGLIVASGTDSRLAGQGPEAYYLLTPTGTPASPAAVPSPTASSPPASAKGGGAVDWFSLLLIIVLSANAAYARRRQRPPARREADARLRA